MDRDAFIRLCVDALSELEVAEKNDPGACSPSAVYDRLTYSYPELRKSDLEGVLKMIYDGVSGATGDCRAGATLHPVLGLLLDGVPASGTANDVSPMRDPVSCLTTVFDTLRDKAQSPAENLTLWQQLYGVHVFALLAASAEDVLEAHEWALSCHGLTEESTWEGRFVDVVKELMKRLVGRQGMSGERRREVVLGVLEGVVLCTRSSFIATVVFEILFDASEVTFMRVRSSRMVGAAILADVRLVKVETAKRALFEMIGPELEHRHAGSDEDAKRHLLVAAGVCLEHVVYQLMTTKRNLASARVALEAEVIQTGLWGKLTSEMIKITEDVVVSRSLLRALVMTSAYSDELRTWSLRVPGFQAALSPPAIGGDDEDDAILRAAWSALNSKEQDHLSRHVRFLRAVFCGSIFADRVSFDNVGTVARTFEMTARLCKALEIQGRVCDGDQDVVARIEQMRVLLSDRIQMVERKQREGQLREEGEAERRRSVLPDVERLRRVDRLLKGLGEVARGSGHVPKSD